MCVQLHGYSLVIVDRLRGTSSGWFDKEGGYVPRRFNTASVIAVTPVRIVGSGTGA